MHTTRGAALLAAAALTVSGLAACGDEGEPSESSSTASPSAVGSESSSEASDSESSSSSESEDTKGDGKVVELPAAATKQTKEGAVAFTKFWFEQSGRAIQTNKTEWLSTNSTSDCPTCRSFIQELESAEKKGISGDRNPTTVSDFKSRKHDDGGYRIEFKLKNSKYSLVDSSGKTSREYAPANLTVVTHTKWQGDRWVLADWLLQ